MEEWKCFETKNSYFLPFMVGINWMTQKTLKSIRKRMCRLVKQHQSCWFGMYFVYPKRFCLKWHLNVIEYLQSGVFEFWWSQIQCDVIKVWNPCHKNLWYPSNLTQQKLTFQNQQYKHQRCKMCYKLIIKTPERHQWHLSEFFITTFSIVSNVNFEHVSVCYVSNLW